MLTVAVLATWGLALAGQAAPVWVEGEDFVAESVLRDGEGKAGLKGDGKGYAAEGWGDTAMMSGGKVLHVNLGGGEVEKFVPEAGLVFARDVDLSVAGPHEIWARIGYEFARSEFDWRWDDGDWATVKPSEPTVDVQPIQTWNELGWLRLATLELRAGKHRLAFRHRPRQVGEPGKEKTERILHMLDAVCIAAPGVFSPCGKWAPGVDHRDEQDRAAEVQVFKVASAPGPDGRAWTQLDGLWQYAPWGETEFPIAEATRLKPVEALPDLGTLRWFAYQAPGSREEQLPEQAFTHRYLLRCRLDVPAETAGRGFFLDVQRSTLIVSAFVNGQRAGSTDTFHTAWQMDLSRFVKPGQANELVLAIKDPYYSLNPQDDANAAALGNRQYWNLPRDFLQANQGVAAKHDLPVAADCRSGLLEPASIVVAGPVYAVDVFAQPRDGKLGLEVTVLNPTDRAVEVEIRNDVVPWNGGEGGVAECAFAPRKITLPPGQAETVQLEQAWANPTRWWPDQPFLYWVRTTLAVDGQPVDEKRTRFGFRTIGWADDQFRINGIKWPMWADQNLPGSPQAVVELSRRSHMNQVRFWSHGGWGPMTRRQALSYFDETGMLVRSSGSFDGQLANYGSGLSEKNENGIRVA
jgi:beta-galactosidase